MAETLRDLVVSLSLNTDNFTRNIRSVQKQIQEAQSEFQLAAAGIMNFEQSAEGLTAKLSTLERTLSLQKDAVSQYEKALTAARDKLQECYSRQTDYAQRLVDAKQKQSELAETVRNAKTAYDTYKNTLGETDSATIAAKQNLESAKEEYKAASDEVRKLQGQNEALKKSTQNAADAVSTANVKLNQANAAMRTTQAAIDKTKQELALANTQWKAAGEAINTAQGALVTIGARMQEAESRFRLATVGVKDLEGTVEGLAAKIVLLNDKITFQEQAVRQYEAALKAAEDQLKAAQQANDPERTKQATDAVIQARTQLNNAKATLSALRQELTETNRQLQTARSAWTTAGKSMTEFGDRCVKAGQNMVRMGRMLSMYVTTPVTALGTTAIKASIDFESAFTDVRKVTVATEEQFAELSNEIKTMSTELAASTTEIAGVVTSASRLGIATDKLMDFTEVMINLGNSTDMTANDAATQIARFANIMGMSADEYENLGSTLVALGNNYATTESEIMAMSLRLAGAGKQVGLSEAEVLAFSAALSAVGIEAQMGGSSMSKALIKMEVAAATGGQALEDFGTVCGLTGEQFKALWENDPATAFQSFIVGLSQMDDAGISAIAVLDEIGISEIRLRDTLLRATNATELFANTQDTAASAWKKGTELASVAEQRYATTASKLTNLKNSAMLFAQTIGDDLNPTVRKLIEGVEEFISKLMDMDSTQRMQIIRMAAMTAAIGPALLLFGRITKSIGVVSKGLGAFALKVGEAGGGFKGFLSVLSSSPAFWFAVAAATIAATVAIADYVSGAREAREALKGMQETAENWKNTAAETFYGNDGLSFFGMSADDFKSEGKADITAAQEWLSGLLRVWTDGKGETNKIVNEWTSSWKALTKTTRDGLESMKTDADAKGYTSLSAGIQKDIDALDAMDTEIAKLLKKRQSKLFTADDEARLQELVNARNTIMVKYRLVPEDENGAGFDTIRQKLEAEVARAQARGKTDADISVYENAAVAAAQGYAAINEQLNEQYDSEYALISLIEDETERQSALNELNAQYMTDRKAAALEYAKLLQETMTPVWNQEDVQEASGQMNDLLTLLREYSMAGETEKPALLTQLQALSSSMDESSITEYIALMTQLQSLIDNGMTEAEVQAMFPEIDFSQGLDQFAGIASYLDLIKSELPGLYSMFNESLPEEVLKIATDLDMTGAQARWDEFAKNPGAITTDAVIQSYSNAEDSALQQVTVDAFIAKYFTTDETDQTALSPEGIVAFVASYAEQTNGADVSGLTPEIATCFVAGYRELASGADISALKPEDIVAYISAYAEKNGVDISGLSPEGITAFVLAYEEIAGGALTSALSPDNITAMVVRYLESEGVDISKLTSAQVDGIVSAYAEATGCDKSQLLTSFTAYVTEYREAEGVTIPQPKTKVIITGYDMLAYKGLQSGTDLELEIPVRLGELPNGEFDRLLSEENVKFWKDGAEVPIELVPNGTVTDDTVAALDKDGTLHILITPEVTGTKEAIDAISPIVDEVDKLGVTTLGKGMGIRSMTQMDMIESALRRINSYQETLDYSAWDKFWASVGGASTDLGVLDESMRLDFSAEDVAGLSAYVSEVVTAISHGGEVAQEDLQNLQKILAFLQGLDETGTGAHIREGIAQGLTEAGWESDAESVAARLESALNGAFVINSPSKRMEPIGRYSAEGIGVGVSQYGFGAEASSVARNLISAVNGSLTSTSLRSASVNAMNGLRAGINAGRSGVISAMRIAARAAVAAAKSELKIHSPSRVFRDEVGAMTMKGFGEGVLRESKEQAKAIQNASRFLTSEAKESAIAFGSTDNRRTYNQQSNVNLSGNTFYIRDDKDVQSLAIEIATLTKRRQNGRGFRMA